MDNPGLRSATIQMVRAALCGWLASVNFATEAGDWYRWRGPDLNGISPETNWSFAWPKEGPAQLWKAEVGTGFSSVTTRHGRLYTLGNTQETDVVHCLEAATGKLLWRHTYPCPLDAQYYEGGPGSTPTVDDAVVYTLSNRGHLFSFDAATGRVLWQKQLMEELGLKKPRWGFGSSPLVQGKLLVLNAGTAGLALDKTNGKLIWTTGTEPAGYATPAPWSGDAKQAVLIFGAKALSAVDLADGHELWRRPWTTKWDINIPQPILSGDRVFVSSFDRGGAMLAISAAQARLVWESKVLRNHFSSCVLFGGHLYGTDGNTDQPGVELRCIEFATGKLKWSHAGLGLGSVLLAGDKLIVLGEKGELVVAQATPEGFQPLARAQVLGGKCWTPPVLSDGRLYCRNAKGTLVCLDLRGAR